MNLAELHDRLSRKPTYRKAYDAIGDVVLIGAAVRKLREDEKITQAELVKELRISQFYLSRLETGSGKVTPVVVAAVVRRFEKPLRKLGINVEPWMAIKLPTPAPQEGRSMYGSRPGRIPESVSRPRHPNPTRERESLVREKPSHKYGRKPS
jgi:transcriptional regulator with XRE-family HTH domain